jgi:hypothetical protein
MRPAPITALIFSAALGLLSTSRAQPAAPAAAPQLVWPVACEVGKTCEVQHYVDRDAGPGVLDYRCGHRTNDKHDGVDIRLLDMAAQRAGVDVLAAAAGRVIAVRDGVPDISIRAPGAPSVVGHECGNRVGIRIGPGWIIDYCHLANGSLKVKVGDAVTASQPLAHIGLSGDTEFPHLHFSVRHDNQVVDPFSPAAAAGCAAAPGTLWTPAAASQAPYKRGVVLNAGFSTAIVDMASIEERAAVRPSAASPGIVAYARLIGLEAGDVIDISLIGPGGKTLATATLPPLDHDKAQMPAEIGRKRPAEGWAHGDYAGVLQVRRAGGVVLTHRWRTQL